jgi:hypothetical protein
MRSIEQIRAAAQSARIRRIEIKAAVPWHKATGYASCEFGHFRPKGSGTDTHHVSDLHRPT